MSDSLYTIFCTFKASVMLSLVFILALLKVQEGSGWALFKRATRYTAFACFILFVSTSRSILVPISVNTLTRIVWIPVSAMQAILFTYNCASFINPNHNLASRFAHYVVYTVISFLALLLLKKFASPEITSIMIYVALSAYFVMIAYFTRMFSTMYAKASAFLEDAYDEDLKDRQRSIQLLFYSALCVGIFSGIAVVVHNSVFYSIFNTSVPFYYLYVVISFINYRYDYSYIVKANYEARVMNLSSPDVDEAAVPTSQPSAQHPESLAAPTSFPISPESEILIKHWIDSKQYLLADATVEEIVKRIGVTRADFIHYFSNTYSTQFRSWRIEMRIHEAERIIREFPSISAELLRERCGYNDRSNFHKHFLKVTGMTINKYKESLGSI